MNLSRNVVRNVYRDPYRNTLRDARSATGWLAGLTAGLATALPAHAHPGHAADALHWHASDLFGLAIVIALGVGALWLARR